MPEGHTLHRLARQHQRWFAGRRVAVTSPQGRFSGAATVDGTRFEAAEAYGKHLFHHYEADRTVHVHLGLFGRFTRHDVPPPAPRDTVRMRVVGRDRAVDLTGATACELVGPDEVAAIVGRLGPDPLRDDADPDAGWAALRRRRVPIGRALLDQAVVAGVGNVYRAEVLFVHGLHPEVPATAVSRQQWCSIWDTLVGWMRGAVGSGVIVTRPDAPDAPDAPELPREDRLHVYRLEACARCGGPVRRWDLAGRWAYACERCQPRP